ncbi:unnamed protein product [Didymodactylos carnosus]|uniref:Uncharacterized protein n=1 Tax=Didymodactylos carnosus TaxID=1234261 RepID=A0A815KHC3_9BILA|nr:unnamed protein product [Didymodactylos carnosus]CAF1392937.1 unnamed protein product [Didymodactylos carnosus]CAF4161168.1 unnamed protein product [Didymodactylos carnosus]CAF4287299.1 unnamed protein product [Didymodactylos carnosus]
MVIKHVLAVLCKFILRSHQQSLITAEEASIINKDGGKHAVTVEGVKGLPKLLEIIEHPTQVVYDYMHLVCLGVA